jgi:transglutaminase superfamily protein
MSSHHSAVASPANRPEAEHRLGPDVLLVPVEDGSARLIDFDGNTFALSDVAARMLRETLSLGIAQAAAICSQHRDVELEHLRADLDTFLTGLLKQDLIVPVSQGFRRPGFAQRLAARAVSVLAHLVCLVRPTAAGKARGLLTVAKLSCRWLGWAQTVRAWQRAFPRSARPLDESAIGQARRVVDVAVREALSHSAMPHACKERGLTGWALARRAGLRPSLVIGISLFPLHGHCWAQLGESFLGDSPERCLQYQPVQIYE